MREALLDFDLKRAHCYLAAVVRGDRIEMQFIMTDENKVQTNRVDHSTNGAFNALWHGQMAYENGRVKRFETERQAWEFLARCDAAGRIIH